MLQREIEHRNQIEKLASIGGFEWCIATNDFWWSKQIKDILKLKSEILKPSLQDLISFIHPNEQKKIQSALEKLPDDAGSFRLHTQILTPDGVEVPILFMAIFETDTQKIIGYIQDVTEDYSERKNLLDTLSKYRGVMSGAGDAIILMSLEGSILEGNTKAAQLFDIEVEKISNLCIEDIHLPDDLDRLMEHYQGALWGQDLLLESIILSQKGHLTPVEISGRPINIGSEKLLVIILHDITQQRNAQNDLKRSEHRYRSLVNEAREGILLLDSTGKIIAANPKICEATGKKRTELLNQNFSDITEFDITMSPIELMEKSHNTNSMHVEGLLNSTESYPSPTGFNIAKSVNTGHVQYIVTAYDLSAVRDGEAERAELQKQLFQSQKLEILGQLAGSLAHDFNNLLSPILLVSEVLIDESKGDELLSRNLNNINLAAQRARRLVGRILDYTRPEDSEPCKIDLRFELEDMLELLRSSIPTTIKINRQINENSYPCFADPDQIHQVLLNISMNAAHSIGDSAGEITFTLEHEIIPEGSPIMADFEMADGAYAKLCVSDTGLGISDDIIDKIFEPFFTTKPQTDGSGLGLSVVMRILQNHNGAIEVKNNLDKGATMIIYLPLLENNGANHVK